MNYRERAECLYGTPLLSGLGERLEKEMKVAKQHKYDTIYKQLAEGLNDILAPCEIHMRGTANSSILTYIYGLSDIEPIGTNLYPEILWGIDGNKQPVTEMVVPKGKYDVVKDRLRCISSVKVFGSDVKEQIYQLAVKTGIKASDIDLQDKELCKFFQNCCENESSIEFVAEQLQFETVPVETVKKAIKLLKPYSRADYVRLFGVLYSTDCWTENQEQFVLEGMIQPNSIISDMETLYEFLMEHGIDRAEAFFITEQVRKGKVLTGEQKLFLKDKGVPRHYIEVLEKIKYLWTRASSISFINDIWRLAYYKLNYPEAYMSL